MSRALTVLGAVLLFSTAGCIHPHARHNSRHRTHGSIYVGWRSHTPPPVVHSHGHGCGHVLVGAEWVVSGPVTRHGSVLHESPEQHVVLEQREVVQEHDGHPGRGKGHDKAQAQAQGKGHGHDKGHDKGQGKGHDKHDD